MALPTAPLGQLPNMNMPYAIPTYEVGPSLWEKALTSFLVSAAGNAAQTGISNAMSRDYAQDFGEEKAGGLQKLINGPRVNGRDAALRRDQAFTAEQSALGREATANQNEVNDLNALERLRMQLEAGRESDMLRADTAQNNAEVDALNADLQRSRAAEDRTALTELEARLHGERPDIKSQVARDNAAAAEAQARADFQSRIMSGFGSGASRPGDGVRAGDAPPATVRPSISNFARGVAAGTTPSTYQSPDDQIRAFLEQGATPDQIVQSMAPNAAPNTRDQNRVQDRALLLEANDAYEAQQMQSIIEDIKRRLGLGIPTGGTITSPTGTRMQ